MIIQLFRHLGAEFLLTARSPARHALKGSEFFRAETSLSEELFSNIVSPVAAVMAAQSDGHARHDKTFTWLCLITSSLLLLELYTLGWRFIFDFAYALK